MIRRTFILTFLLLLCASMAWADTATLGDCADCTGSCDDNMLMQANPNYNYGNRPDFVVGWGASSSARSNAILRFDLSTIPAGSDITAATLNLYVETVNNGGFGAVSVYTIKSANEDWVEGTVNGSTQTGSSDWNYHTHTTQSWAGSAGLQTAGTDYDDTFRDTFDGTSTGAKAITLNSDMLSYLEGKAGSDGAEFFIRELSAYSSFKNVVISSSESTTDSRRPTLELTYTPPSTGAPQVIILQKGW